MAAKLEAILTHEKYDIVHLESIYVSPYINVIRKYSKARIVMRMHNIEHKIWERLADNESNLIKKILYNANRRQLESTEKTILKRVDGYMTISDPDYQYFSKTAPEIPGIIIPGTRCLRRPIQTGLLHHRAYSQQTALHVPWSLLPRQRGGHRMVFG